MTPCAAKPALQRRQGGGSLVEVMIAVLVFSLGLLGTAATQLQARKNLFDASQRSRATTLAADIVARMRANPLQLAAYEVTELGDPGRVPAPPPADCQRLPCSPGELAIWDVYDWYGLLSGSTEMAPRAGEAVPAGGLVEPRACISEAGGQVQLLLVWRGRGDPLISGSDGCSTGLGPAISSERRYLQLTTYIGQWP